MAGPKAIPLYAAMEPIASARAPPDHRRVGRWVPQLRNQKFADQSSASSRAVGSKFVLRSGDSAQVLRRGSRTGEVHRAKFPER